MKTINEPEKRPELRAEGPHHAGADHVRAPHEERHSARDIDENDDFCHGFSSRKSFRAVPD